jgi:histidyl-tRNA synthetase
MEIKTDLAKGFRDIEDSSKRSKIKSIISETFKLYNFLEVETPIIEYEEFVKGNNTNDEVISDIYKLKDKGDRALALRYEFTFQLRRISKNKKLPYKRFQIGPVFRDEPITGNRWRQFTQCDADIVGSSIKDEAEILKIVTEILNKLDIGFTIKINNRKLLNEILEDLKIDEKNKAKVIVEIDKLDKQPETEVKKALKEYNAESALEIFKKPEKYFEKYKSYEEIKELKKYCDLYRIEINFSPFLARGLSYYNGTVIEIKTKDIKETICAGGSYLVNGIQSTGISFGLDRLELLSNIKLNEKKALIISLDQDKKAIELINRIRSSGLPCSIYYNKLSKALEYANSLKYDFVFFVGETEVKDKKLKLKDMTSGKEKLILEKDLEKEIKKLI